MDKLYNDAYASRTVQRWEHQFPLIGPTGAENWEAGAVVELARINIPVGYYAEIIRIDTLIQDISTGQPLHSWDNPETFDPSFQFALSYNPVNDKYFNDNNDRAVLFSASTLPWFDRIAASPLPGLTFWKDGRYQWGNPSNEMELPVADQVVVRLLVNCITATPYKHRVKGRLIAGYSLKRTREAQERAML